MLFSEVNEHESKVTRWLAVWRVGKQETSIPQRQTTSFVGGQDNFWLILWSSSWGGWQHSLL